MRILIKDGTRSINLRLPTCLIFSKTVAKIGGFAVRNYDADTAQSIPPEAMEQLFAELRRIKKKHKNWELIDIESADGEIVKIIL